MFYIATTTGGSNNNNFRFKNKAILVLTPVVVTEQHWTIKEN